jgi:ABC-type arginine transport system permease subunit
MRLLVAAVAVLVALAIVAPKLMRLRIRFFKWLHWTWAARVLEEHFERWVLVIRTVLLVLAVALLFFGVATAL